MGWENNARNFWNGMAVVMVCGYALVVLWTSYAGFGGVDWTQIPQRDVFLVVVLVISIWTLLVGGLRFVFFVGKGNRLWQAIGNGTGYVFFLFGQALFVQSISYLCIYICLALWLCVLRFTRPAIVSITTYKIEPAGKAVLYRLDEKEKEVNRRSN